jgi:putative oxidoreductase
MKCIPLLGRFLYSLIFIMANLGHFSKDTIAYAASQGVPMPMLLVPASGIIGLAGGLSILLGYKTHLGAWLLVIFLIPVTFLMHSFWEIDDPQMAMMQQIMLMKNLGLLGGALLLTHFGAGPLSLDALWNKKA